MRLPSVDVGAHEPGQRGPAGIVGDLDQIDRCAAGRLEPIACHLDDDRPLFEPEIGQPREEAVGRERVGMDDAPVAMREMLVHRREHRVDFRIALGGHLVGVIGVPQIGLGRIGDDRAVRQLDHAMPEPPLPAIGFGDQASGHPRFLLRLA